MHCRRANYVYYFTAPWVIKAITPMHTDNPLSHQITSPVTSFFFWLTHIGQLPPDLAGVSTSVLHKVLENILLHSVLAVRTPSFRSCLAPLWCACKKKKQLTMKLSPLHYVKQSPQGCLEMRSSSWSPSCCLNGEGPRTIAAFYLTRPIRQKFTGAFSYQQSCGNSENV